MRGWQSRTSNRPSALRSGIITLALADSYALDCDLLDCPSVTQWNATLDSLELSVERIALTPLVITDIEDPKFDLEKVIESWTKDS